MILTGIGLVPESDGENAQSTNHFSTASKRIGDPLLRIEISPTRPSECTVYSTSTVPVMLIRRACSGVIGLGRVPAGEHSPIGIGRVIPAPSKTGGPAGAAICPPAPPPNTPPKTPPNTPPMT